MSRTATAATWILVTFLCFACSSKTANVSIGAPVPEVGSIIVVASSSIDDDDRKLLDEVNATARLKTVIEGELGKKSKLKSGSVRVLEVKVTEFRLRSGVTLFLAGIMAGVDTLQVSVTVREGNHIVRQFTTGDSTSGSFAGLSFSARFQTMADAVGARLVQEL